MAGPQTTREALMAELLGDVGALLDRAEALQAAADQAKENQSLRLVILDQAPKVAAIKRLASAAGAICPPLLTRRQLRFS